MLSGIMPLHFVFFTLLAGIDILLVMPANLITVLVIIRKKDLWTPSNIVLSINGIIQGIGSVIYAILRSVWFHDFFLLPMNNDYKETVYCVFWWTGSIMMRAGNNR